MQRLCWVIAPVNFRVYFCICFFFRINIGGNITQNYITETKHMRIYGSVHRALMEQMAFCFVVSSVNYGSFILLDS